MKIGEIVEALIRVRDRNALTEEQDTAVCAACNILDHLPNMMEEEDAEKLMWKFAKTTRKCPRCGQPLTGHPALSRVDNETLICPDCGTREALESMGMSKEGQDTIIEAIHRTLREVKDR